MVTPALQTRPQKRSSEHPVTWKKRVSDSTQNTVVLHPKLIAAFWNIVQKRNAVLLWLQIDYVFNHYGRSGDISFFEASASCFSSV